MRTATTIPEAKVNAPTKQTADRAPGYAAGALVSGDEPLAAHPVRQAAGDELSYAPDGWIDRGKKGDIPQAETSGAEDQREKPPRHAVVQVPL